MNTVGPLTRVSNTGVISDACVRGYVNTDMYQAPVSMRRVGKKHCGAVIFDILVLTKVQTEKDH